MSAPRVTRDDKLTLWRLLSDGKWHKAKDLAPHWGNNRYIPPRTGNPRIIRAICEAEPDKFISTQKGYKRADLATDEELTNAINDLRSRAKKMTERANAIEQALWERSQPMQLRVFE